jgi:hypothetical protein
MRPGVHVAGIPDVERVAAWLDVGDAGRAAVALDGVVRREVRPPALDLALEPPVRLAEVAEADGVDVHPSEGGDAVGHRQSHGVLHRRVRAVRLREPERRVEAVDRLHQVEGCTQQLDVGAGGDEGRVGHVRPRQGREHPRLTAHRLVAVGPLVGRRPAEHEGPGAPTEAQQHVLGAAGDALDVPDRRARLEAPVVHPPGQHVEVDGAGLRPGAHRAAPTMRR